MKDKTKIGKVEEHIGKTNKLKIAVRLIDTRSLFQVIRNYNKNHR